jgi:hypothetical protein
MLWLVLFLAVAQGASAQAVLFDGLVQPTGRASLLLAPVQVTESDYTAFGRVDFGVAPRFNLFLQGGGEFNGGATALAGAGWSATFVQQSATFPLNFGFFNSFVFPLRSGGPDALITLSPVFSHSFEWRGGRITPFAGPAATVKVNAPGTDVNAVLGLKLAPIGPRWDFVAEVQAGERSHFALGFVYRF